MPDLNNNKTDAGTSNRENVSALLKDPEIRNLPMGSNEFNAAVDKKLSAKNELQPEESATPDDVVENDDGEEAEDETSEAEDSAEVVEEKPKGKKGLSKRLAVLTKARTDAEKRAEALEARIAELENGSNPSKAEAKSEEEEPSLDKFANIDDFVKAHGAWTIKRYEADSRKKQTEQEAQVAYKKSVATFVERGKQLETDLGLEPGEFGVVVGDRGFILFEGTQHILFNSEHGAKVAYEIANDDDLKKKVLGMNPVQQIAFVAKLEAKHEAKSEVSKPSKEKTQVLTKAKKPARPITGGGGSSVNAMPNPKENFAEFQQWLKQQKG